MFPILNPPPTSLHVPSLWGRGRGWDDLGEYFLFKNVFNFKEILYESGEASLCLSNRQAWNLRGFHSKVFHHPCVHAERGVLAEDGVGSSASQSHSGKPTQSLHHVVIALSGT